jgi:hypothetical protein
MFHVCILIYFHSIAALARKVYSTQSVRTAEAVSVILARLTQVLH